MEAAEREVLRHTLAVLAKGKQPFSDRSAVEDKPDRIHSPGTRSAVL
jgi:hypothetical protein